MQALPSIGEYSIICRARKPLNTLAIRKEQRNTFATVSLGVCRHTSLGVNVEFLVVDALSGQVGPGLLTVAAPCGRIQHNTACGHV